MAESYESSKNADPDCAFETNKPAKPVILTFVNRSFGVPPPLPVRDTTKFSEDLANVVGCHSPDATTNDNSFYSWQKGNSFRRNSQVIWFFFET